MQARNVAPCQQCGRLVSRRCGVHRTCLAQRPVPWPPLQMMMPQLWLALQCSHPWMRSVLLLWTLGILLGLGCCPKQSGLSHSVWQPWCNTTPRMSGPTAGCPPTDRPAAGLWTELWLFSKACLATCPGGRSKHQQNHNILANRLDRWLCGERRELWDEVVGLRARRRPQLELAEDERQLRLQEKAVSLAQRGLPGQAVDRLGSLGVAPDTPHTEARMRSKFVQPPPRKQRPAVCLPRVPMRCWSSLCCGPSALSSAARLQGLVDFALTSCSRWWEMGMPTDPLACCSPAS